MSSRKNKRPPVPDDQYFTPDWVVELACDVVVPRVLATRSLTLHGARVLDPGAGQGSFTFGALAKRANVVAIEKQDRAVNSRRYPRAQADLERFEVDRRPETGRTTERLTLMYGTDFLDVDLVEDWQKRFDLTLGNPPFTLAREFVERSLEVSEQVVFLLRLAFLTSTKRAKWFAAHKPTDVFLLPQRPSFGVPSSYEAEHGEVNGNDSADYAFFCWDRRRPNPWTTLHWLPTVKDRERG